MFDVLRLVRKKGFLHVKRGLAHRSSLLAMLSNRGASNWLIFVIDADGQCCRIVNTRLGIFDIDGSFICSNQLPDFLYQRLNSSCAPHNHQGYPPPPTRHYQRSTQGFLHLATAPATSSLHTPRKQPGPETRNTTHIQISIHNTPQLGQPCPCASCPHVYMRNDPHLPSPRPLPT